MKNPSKFFIFKGFSNNVFIGEIHTKRGAIAQLVERFVRNEKVSGFPKGTPSDGCV